MRTVQTVGVALLVASFMACKTISNESKQNLAKPVDCSSANRDIAALEAERVSVGKQIASGVRMVFPAAAVAGILSGDYKNRAQVASGKYNAALAAKITEIKQTCAVD